jgi:hypothetical protein
MSLKFFPGIQGNRITGFFALGIAAKDFRFLDLRASVPVDGHSFAVSPGDQFVLFKRFLVSNKE